MFTPYIPQKLLWSEAMAYAMVRCGDGKSPAAIKAIRAALKATLRMQSVLPTLESIVSLAAGLNGNAFVPAHDDAEPTARQSAVAMWPADTRKPGDTYMFMPLFESIPFSLRGKEPDGKSFRRLLRPYRPLPHQYKAFRLPADAGRVVPMWCVRSSDIDGAMLTELLVEGYSRQAFEYGGGRKRNPRKRKAAAVSYVGVDDIVRRVKLKLATPTPAPPSVKKLKEARAARMKLSLAEAIEAKRADGSANKPPPLQLNSAEEWLFKTVAKKADAAKAAAAAFNVRGATTMSLDNAPPCVKAFWKHNARAKNIGRYSVMKTVYELIVGGGPATDIEDLVMKPLVKVYETAHGPEQGRKMRMQYNGVKKNRVLPPPFKCGNMKGLRYVGVEMTCPFQSGESDNVERCCATRKPVDGHTLPTQDTAYPALVWATTLAES